MAAREMYDYLSSATADNNYTLNVSPNKVIVEEGSKKQLVRIGDDGSEERISFSDDSIFYVTLIWTYKNESDAGTIMDFYHDADKGNGIAETFKWLSPDGHIYTVRFDGPLRRQLIATNGIRYDFPSVRLRVVGESSIAINADDVQSSTELTAPAIGVIHPIAAADNASATEITAPSIGIV